MKKAETAPLIIETKTTVDAFCQAKMPSYTSSTEGIYLRAQKWANMLHPLI